MVTRLATRESPLMRRPLLPPYWFTIGAGPTEGWITRVPSTKVRGGCGSPAKSSTKLSSFTVKLLALAMVRVYCTVSPS